ncbi:helix-turn-helix domain-containing protein [Kitasatospora sp. NPDC006697]|uniref:helix-turn-helix domain-containing protein n=1 Tax=Kitasatospora sp. NPDC006697 TaxID=3364020 RepID=UPI00368F4E55
MNAVRTGHAAGGAGDRQPSDIALKDLRKAQGRTQADVARALGVSQARVSQIENRDPASMELDTIRAYAAALGGLVAVTISIGTESVKVA